MTSNLAPVAGPAGPPALAAGPGWPGGTEPARNAATVSAGAVCACPVRACPISDPCPGLRSMAATGTPRSAASSCPVISAVTVWPAPLVQPRNTMRRGPASGSRARSRSSVSRSRLPGPWPPGTTRTRRCQLSIRSAAGPLRARSIDGTGRRGCSGTGGCSGTSMVGVGAAGAGTSAGVGTSAAGGLAACRAAPAGPAVGRACGGRPPGMAREAGAPGPERRDEGRPQSGTAEGPCVPCVSCDTSMAGGVIGSGPRGAGAASAGSRSTRPGIAGRRASGRPPDPAAGCGRPGLAQPEPDR